MSRRITIETELTDLQALQQACEASPQFLRML
jgi:hypothetical protein